MSRITTGLFIGFLAASPAWATGLASQTPSSVRTKGGTKATSPTPQIAVEPPPPTTTPTGDMGGSGGTTAGGGGYNSGGPGGDGAQGCSGHAAGYPPGWTFKAVFQYNTSFNSICTAYLYQPDGTLDECLGNGDCETLCSNNIG